MFQFYGNLPIGLAGLINAVFNTTPFFAWKLVMLAAMTVGGYFTFRCSYQLTRHPAASLVAGVLFMTAPYYLCDLYQRAAYSEFTGLNLLPMAFYFTLKLFASHRQRVRRIVLCGLSWTLVGLSHNITYLYGERSSGSISSSRPSRCSAAASPPGANTSPASSASVWPACCTPR